MSDSFVSYIQYISSVVCLPLVTVVVANRHHRPQPFCDWLAGIMQVNISCLGFITDCLKNIDENNKLNPYHSYYIIFK